MASNHLAVMDSLYFPLLLKRQLTFLAEKEYFTTPGFAGAGGGRPADRTRTRSPLSRMLVEVEVELVRELVRETTRDRRTKGMHDDRRA